MSSESSTHPGGQPLSVVIAGGGTGGHISPAVAVIDELRNRGPVDLHWIGSRNGFEGEAAERAGVPFSTVRTGKLRRYIARQTIIDAVRVPAGIIEARRILKRVQPDVVFSTGGFVSTPTVIAARTTGIPSMTHEQTASVGLATRINARFCDVVALSFPGVGGLRTRKHARTVVTGNPVRPAILNGSCEALKALFDVPEHLPLIYVTGGAQGAHAVNQVIEASLPELLERAAIIHQCGPQSGNGDYQRLLMIRSSLPRELRNRYVPVERVGDELAHIYAACSLVIGRAGAGTIAELATLGLPAILVPLPGAEEQRRNARVLVKAGGALMVEQDRLTVEALTTMVRDVLSDQQKLECMRAGSKSIATPDAASRIVDEIYTLAGRTSNS